jgi:hypothetical protein
MWPQTKAPSRIKESVKEWVPIAQAIVTILAVIFGGWWTYKLFIEQREQYPHANIEQKLSHVALIDRPGNVAERVLGVPISAFHSILPVNLLRVVIELTNVGKTLMTTGDAIIRVQQILPPACQKVGPCVVRDEIGAAINNVKRQEDRFSWRLIGERVTSFDRPYDLEPGEKQSFEFEFVTPSEVKLVLVYAYFRNDKRCGEGREIGWYAYFRKRSCEGEGEIGWDVSSYYDFHAAAVGF